MLFKRRVSYIVGGIAIILSILFIVSNTVILSLDSGISSNGGIPINKRDTIHYYECCLGSFQREAMGSILPDHTIITREPVYFEIPRIAYFDYSAPRRLNNNQRANVNVAVSLDYDSIALRLLVNSLIRDQERSEPSVEAIDISRQRLPIYKYVRANLIDPDNSFTITAIHPSDRVSVDINKLAHWNWTVRPNTPDSQALLILRIIAESAEGDTTEFKRENIRIGINIDHPTLWKKTIVYLGEPANLLKLVLIPVVGYIVKLTADWFKKRRDDKKDRFTQGLE